MDEFIEMCCPGFDSEDAEKFINGLLEIISNDEISVGEFEKRINIYLNSRKKMNGVDDSVLTILGDALIRNDDNEKGIVLLKNALRRPDRYGEYTDGTTLFIRLAEYEFLRGNEEKGIEYMIHVCEEEAENYIEAIGFRDLTDVWDKYKHYVVGKVRESYEFTVKAGKLPDECTKKISDILENSDENQLLLDLSIHINQMCADGDDLVKLNKWERNFFYVDLLWTEVNSGGFDSYLSSYGNYFDKTLKAAMEIGIVELVDILEKVKNIFPKGKVPKSVERIGGVILEKDLNFDVIDEEFYEEMDGIIMDKMMLYIQENKKRFR